MLTYRQGITAILLSFFLVSCNSTYTSKKKGYYFVDLPATHEYRAFGDSSFPFSFEYPLYGTIIRDSTYFDESAEEKYWINVDFPSVNARIFLSYKQIGANAIYKVKQADGSYKDSLAPNRFDRMVNDAFNLTNKNESVATSISDSLFRTTNNVTGVYFRVGGNAATARQFFVSDTTRNFLRGALYFNAQPNIDSIKPVLEFLEADMQHLIQTFKWR